MFSLTWEVCLLLPVTKRSHYSEPFLAVLAAEMLGPISQMVLAVALLCQDSFVQPSLSLVLNGPFAKMLQSTSFLLFHTL